MLLRTTSGGERNSVPGECGRRCAAATSRDRQYSSTCGPPARRREVASGSGEWWERATGESVTGAPAVCAPRLELRRGRGRSAWISYERRSFLGEGRKGLMEDTGAREARVSQPSVVLSKQCLEYIGHQIYFVEWCFIKRS